MKLLSNLLLVLLILFLYENYAFSLSDYRIKKICENKQRRDICLKELKTKKFNLLKGNQIEIPVIPYKK